MRIILQRVKYASVSTGGREKGAIGPGLLAFLAIHENDEEWMIEKMADKILNLRIFTDPAGKMNLSLRESGGELMVISEFTLYADTRKGNRPSFVAAARPEKAKAYYDDFISRLDKLGFPAVTGEFGAMMEVALLNDGPVTIPVVIGI